MVNGCVYIVDFGDFVKVGETTRFSLRIKQLRKLFGAREAQSFIYACNDRRVIEQKLIQSLYLDHQYHEKCKKEIFLKGFDDCVKQLKLIINNLNSSSIELSTNKIVKNIRIYEDEWEAAKRIHPNFSEFARRAILEKIERDK
jgi:uncharacterized FAD-dependent dehydrogenase